MMAATRIPRTMSLDTWIRWDDFPLITPPPLLMNFAILPEPLYWPGSRKCGRVSFIGCYCVLLTDESYLSYHAATISLVLTAEAV